MCCVLSQFLFACLLSCVCERVLVLWKLLGRCPILVPPTLFGQHCKRFWLFWYNYKIPFKIPENSWTLNIGRKLDWEYLQSWKRGINWNWIWWNDTQRAYIYQINQVQLIWSGWCAPIHIHHDLVLSWVPLEKICRVIENLYARWIVNPNARSGFRKLWILSLIHRCAIFYSKFLADK